MSPIAWSNVTGSTTGNYIQGEYRGMHCELFFNNNAWGWSFYDDDSPEPDLAVARGDKPTKEEAETDLIDYINGYKGEENASG